MTGLAELLADCDAHGIRLLPAGDGGLTIDAPQDALTPAMLARLKARKAELLASLLPAVDAGAAVVQFSPEVAAWAMADETWANTRPANIVPTKPTGAVCRCGSTMWRDVPIHGGQSVRRDCGRCGRFLDFPVWYGKDTLQNET